MSIICAFFGHRNIPENLEPHLHELVERAITEYGATEFWDGYYGGFDELAADVVISLKTKYPHIRLKRIFAYSPTNCIPRRGFDANVYPEMLDQYPDSWHIPRRNLWMAAQCNLSPSPISSTRTAGFTNPLISLPAKSQCSTWALISRHTSDAQTKESSAAALDFYWLNSVT